MKTKLLIVLALACAVACHRESKVPPPAGQTATAAKTATSTSQPPAAVKTESGTPPSTEVGGSMPAYTAKRLDGSPFDLTGERQKVVFLNVWATWCGPCRFETPELQKLHEKYAARGFEVVGVSVDENGAEAVKPFVAEQKINYPMVLDPEGRIANLLQTTVLPTSVVIDRGGKIVWRRVGALVGADPTLDAALEKALKKALK